LQELGAISGSALLAGNAVPVWGRDERSTFEFLVIGDSLVWGQGLEEEHKFYFITKRWLGDEVFGGSRQVKLNVKAHSGSTILLNDREAAALLEAERDIRKAVHPEINVSFPSIKEQLAAARKEYSKPESVDLIMLSGGVPEVGVSKILNPFQSNYKLRADIRLYCRQHMSVLLEQTAEAFPNAVIAVIGYYPIITRYTPVKRIVNDILELYNWPGWTKPLINNPLNRILWRRYRRKMIERSRIWLEDSSRELGYAVADLNARTAEDRAIFIKPPFAEEHGYGAKNSMLWRVGSRGRATDPLSPDRNRECRPALEELRRHTDLRYRTRVCELASIGHPNQNGAAAIAEAVKLAIRPLIAANLPRQMSASAP
jgi:lysophospholipase L1-like esterase